MFDTISLLIQGSLEGELKLMDELAGPGGQPSAFPSAPSPGGSDPQVTVPCHVPLPLTVPSYPMLCCASGVLGGIACPRGSWRKSNCKATVERALHLEGGRRGACCPGSARWRG